VAEPHPRHHLRSGVSHRVPIAVSSRGRVHARAQPESMQLWRISNGMVVEHWACRDDMGVLGQLRDS
jgi:hypothetical protein